MGQGYLDQVCALRYGPKDVCKDVIVVRPQNCNHWTEEK